MRRIVLVMVCAWAVPALADRGAVREALDGLKRLIDRAEDADAPCGRKLARRLESIRDDLREDGRSRRVLSQLEEARDFAEESCPRRLAKLVGDGLDEVKDALRAGREAGRRERARDDDDDDERPRDRGATVRRDCGTQDDPGCGPSRGGLVAMDAATYRGFLASVKQNPNELTRLDTVRAVVANQGLTAKQLGPILDAFQNELLRLDAAKAAAPHLIDPAHALGHATKWRNSLLAADYSALMTQH